MADDERDVREYLQELLPRLGHKVVAAAPSGRQLLEVCKTPPELLITDIKMPDMDGIELAATINRAHPTPVILLSAHHDTDLLARLAADHIMAYLIKPVTEAELKAAIALALVRFAHFQALAKEATDLRQALEDRKTIERAKGIIMKRLRVDEEEAFRRLRKLASDHNEKLIDVSRNVVSADQVFHEMDRA